MNLTKPIFKFRPCFHAGRMAVAGLALILSAASAGAAPALVASASSVIFEYQLGANAVKSKAITVTSADGSPLVADASFAPLSGAGWLSVRSTGGQTPVTFSLVPNAAGLSPGVYTGILTVKSAAAANSPQVFVSLTVRKPILLLSPGKITFQYQSGLSAPAPQQILVSGANQGFTVSTATSKGTPWLSATPTSGTTPQSISVSTTPSLLLAGTYTGTVTVTSAVDPTNVQTAAVILIVTDGAQLSSSPAAVVFEGQSGSNEILSQLAYVASTGDTFTFNASVSFGPGPQWLSVAPTQATMQVGLDANGLSKSVPYRLSLFANVAGLSPGTYSANLILTTDENPSFAGTVPVTLIVRGTTAIVPSIADGGNSKTSISLFNFDVDPTAYGVKFWRSDGTPLALPLTGIGVNSEYADTNGMPVKNYRTLQTDGTAGTLSEGWAEINSAKAMGSLAVLTQRAQNGLLSVGSMAATGGSERFFLPFDSTNNRSTRIALVNPNATQSTLVALSMRDENGAVLRKDNISLPPRSRTAFVMTERYPALANSRGFAEFDSPGVKVAGVGFQFNAAGVFTTVNPVEPPSATDALFPRLAGQVLDGGNFRTDFLLVNTSTSPAPFSVVTRTPGGGLSNTPLDVRIDTGEFTDVIPPGGSRFFGTQGAAGSLSIGWAQVFTSNAVDGVVIYRRQTPGSPESDVAAPLVRGRNAFYLMPVDTTQNSITRFTLVNPDTLQPVSSQLTFRNPTGQEFLTSAIQLDPLNQLTFSAADRLAPIPNFTGVAEFSSNSNVPGMGLLFGPEGTITLMPALRK